MQIWSTLRISPVSGALAEAAVPAVRFIAIKGYKL
jgi:hypothetical protein